MREATGHVEGHVQRDPERPAGTRGEQEQSKSQEQKQPEPKKEESKPEAPKQESKPQPPKQQPKKESKPAQEESKQVGGRGENRVCYSCICAEPIITNSAGQDEPHASPYR